MTLKIAKLTVSFNFQRTFIFVEVELKTIEKKQACIRLSYTNDTISHHEKKLFY